MDESLALEMYLHGVFNGVSTERLESTINKFKDFERDCTINQQGKIVRDIYSALIKIKKDRGE